MRKIVKFWTLILLVFFSGNSFYAQCTCINSEPLLAQLNTSDGKPAVRICGNKGLNPDTFSEFSVIECKTGKELLFFSAAEECYIKVTGNKKINITKIVYLPTGKNWKFRPESALRYTISTNTQEASSIEKKCVIQIRDFSKEEIREVDEEYAKAVTGNIWSEELVGKLGVIALSGSSKGRELFEKAEKEIPGGSDGEYYNEINEIYKEHFKDNNVSQKPCDGLQLPESLLHQIKAKFPDDRIVMNYSEVALHEYFHDKTPLCPGMIQADFDGNGKTDWVFLMANEKKQEAMIISAMHYRKKWVIEVVVDYHDCPIGSAYVELLPPGNYEALDPEKLTEEEIKQGVRNQYTSKHHGFYHAYLEACGTSYFWTNKGWIKI